MSDSNDEGNQSRDGEARRPGKEPQALRRELWLDLESTVITPVIEGWWKSELINVEKVKDVIASFAPHRINIFSFAIWNSLEREKFNQGTRPMLEQALGVELNLVLTVDEDIIPACCKEMGIQPVMVDFQEMSNFWSKQGAFRLCMRSHAANHRRHNLNLPLHVLLLDDAVYNEVMRWPDLQTIVEQRNIDQL